MSTSCCSWGCCESWIPRASLEASSVLREGALEAGGTATAALDGDGRPEARSDECLGAAGRGESRRSRPAVRHARRGRDASEAERRRTASTVVRGSRSGGRAAESGAPEAHADRKLDQSVRVGSALGRSGRGGTGEGCPCAGAGRSAAAMGRGPCAGQSACRRAVAWPQVGQPARGL